MNDSEHRIKKKYMQHVTRRDTSDAFDIICSMITKIAKRLLFMMPRVE